MSTATAFIDEAKRIASQFSYPAESVRRDVAEFINEIDEGLTQEGTTLSQIPTFITSVPDGSEKVHTILSLPRLLLLSGSLVANRNPSPLRVYTWRLTLVAQTSVCAP